MTITITDSYLNLIKSALGYPTEDGEFLLTDPQIKEFCIAPAPRQYFAKFPYSVQTEYDISFNELLSVNYPDEDTYGITDARITHQEYPTADSSWTNFLYTAQYNNQVSTKNFGRAGYNPNSLSQASMTAYQALRSKANMSKTIRIHVNHEERLITAETNRGSKLLVTWAKYSDDFTNVRYNYIQDVIELSQGHMMKHAARTMGIFQNTNMPVNINYDFLNSEGDALLTKVLDKWNEISGVLLIKN